MAEYLTLFDKDGRDTGFVQLRDETVRAGAYYMVVSVFARDENGDFLVTQRSPQKQSYPLCWEVTGGCVQAGESSELGARRELEEETGLVPEQLTYLGRVTCPTRTGGAFFLVEVFEARVKGKAPAIRMQEGEVCDYKWVDARGLARVVKEEPMEHLVPVAFEAFCKELVGEV